MLAVSGSDSKVRESDSELYRAREGRSAEIRKIGRVLNSASKDALDKGLGN